MIEYTRKVIATDNSEAAQFAALPNISDKKYQIQIDQRTGKIISLITDDADIISWMDATGLFIKTKKA